jgi:hypothetical protein
MRIVTYAELRDLPPGTIFCDRDGTVAICLSRKGETVEGGIWNAELLPQTRANHPVPRWWNSTLMPPPYEGDDADLDWTFFVFDAEDVETLIGLLRGEPEQIKQEQE